jgi:sirohydrochlorin ferrochelatase
MSDSLRPSLLLVGHGSRSEAGVAAYWELAAQVRQARPDLEVGCGFIELAEPHLDEAIDALVGAGADCVAVVPLLLLGAGHMKNDGPAVLAEARRRHPSARFEYGRPLGIHPLVLAATEDRINEALGSQPINGGPPAGAASGPSTAHQVLLVGRGSSDPDANSDLYKVARMLSEGRGLPSVEPAFVSLATPSVAEGLERCRQLGATRITVVPYFLFTGVLVERIAVQARSWADAHPAVSVVQGGELGPDPRIVQLVLERHDEAMGGTAHMNCDCCVYRSALPGFESRVGAPAGGPLASHSHPHSV